MNIIKVERAGEPAANPSDSQLLTIDGLEVDYPIPGRRKPFRAVDRISLHVGIGETLGVVGESGSGKTSVGRAVLGLAPVSGGRVTFDGRDISHLSRRARRGLSKDIQVIFQDPYTSLNPLMAVGDILTEPLAAVGGMNASKARTRVADLLEMVGLPRGADRRFPRDFSGGQRQRIAIARALALDPRLIVCDEPVSALDLTTQERILALLIELQERTRVAYLFVSHDLDVVRVISHRTVVMSEGRIIEAGATDSLMQDPQHPSTQKLIMSNPVLDPDEQRERRRRRALLSSPATT
ncbi:ABC transporter ATP-binding protein [Arthrobacter sp. GMC3]|uniref:ABC transporter ATP-binding protein n=1 Tax=Arthrobacter sp. GMC3 TaxID=2058894 RepID=UPI000CE45186|nr:ATP-binding cassette domain-containing protein [Arthrobacter sp. GMC3]